MSDFIRYFIEDMAEEVVEVACVAMLSILKYVPGIQLVNEAVRIRLHSLVLAPDELKTQEMYEKAVKDDPRLLEYVPDNLKDLGMCERLKTHGCC